MEKIQTKAYHGTTKSRAENILKTKKFYESTKPTEWLGHGVYFFQYKAHAMRWANNEVGKARNAEQTPEVIAVDLVYSDDQVLDLDDPDDLEALNQVVKAALLSIPEDFCADLERDQKKKWCFSCNLFRKIHKNIGITFYTFPISFRRNAPNNCFRENQRQICVNHQSIILWETFELLDYERGNII